MITRFVGDVHGLKYELGLILGNLPNDVSSVIQVGDMGVGFGQGDYWHESLDETLNSVKGRWIRGNHDNPSQCREMKSWIPDGLIENNMMFLGGAWSIDYAYRAEGKSWWKDEELSYEELDRMLSIYDLVRPRVMVTHDCPLSVSKQLFIDSGKCFSKQQYNTRTGSALEHMFELHQPELWLFGHWHFDEDKVINGTRFICLNELSYVDVDMKTLEVIWPEYQARRLKT